MCGMTVETIVSFAKASPIIYSMVKNSRQIWLHSSDCEDIPIPAGHTIRSVSVELLFRCAIRATCIPKSILDTGSPAPIIHSYRFPPSGVDASLKNIITPDGRYVVLFRKARAFLCKINSQMDTNCPLATIPLDVQDGKFMTVGGGVVILILLVSARTGIPESTNDLCLFKIQLFEESEPVITDRKCVSNVPAVYIMAVRAPLIVMPGTTPGTVLVFNVFSYEGFVLRLPEHDTQTWPLTVKLHPVLMKIMVFSYSRVVISDLEGMFLIDIPTHLLCTPSDTACMLSPTEACVWETAVASSHDNYTSLSFLETISPALPRSASFSPRLPLAIFPEYSAPVPPPKPSILLTYSPTDEIIVTRKIARTDTPTGGLIHFSVDDEFGQRGNVQRESVPVDKGEMRLCCIHPLGKQGYDVALAIPKDLSIQSTVRVSSYNPVYGILILTEVALLGKSAIWVVQY
ncbi:hypothetical protein SISSUDRAFT_1051093 [Sistotremastrum suecicum HHB10207 ss-3]|uniref:Uncharacterized protein n=1 Tax=Sistotremastrum suecicum HHB10207 ss-3 TaxID=1314776 RepID=A0A166ATP6_9AGAM|nr:hypothetical protein SISSUDRAFT_1051093 [Sistotremastrum suecicum HHB10207 ss-3]